VALTCIDRTGSSEMYDFANFEFQVLDSKLRHSHSRYNCSLISLRKDIFVLPSLSRRLTLKCRLIKTKNQICPNQIEKSTFKFGGLLILSCSIRSLTRAGNHLKFVPVGECLVKTSSLPVISELAEGIKGTKGTKLSYFGTKGTILFLLSPFCPFCPQKGQFCPLFRGQIAKITEIVPFVPR
jgi:hypothetical protein